MMTKRHPPILGTVLACAVCVAIMPGVAAAGEKPIGLFHDPAHGITVPVPAFDVSQRIVAPPAFGYGLFRDENARILITVGPTRKRAISLLQTTAELGTGALQKLHDLSEGQIDGKKFVRFDAVMRHDGKVNRTLAMEIAGDDRNLNIVCTCDPEAHAELTSDIAKLFTSVRLGDQLPDGAKDLPSYRNEQLKLFMALPQFRPSAEQKDKMSAYFASPSEDGATVIVALAEEPFPSQSELDRRMASVKEAGGEVTVLQDLPGDVLLQFEMQDAAVYPRYIRLGNVSVTAIAARNSNYRRDEITKILKNCVQSIQVKRPDSGN